MFTYHFESGWRYPERSFPSVKRYSTFKQAFKAAMEQRKELAINIDPELSKAGIIIEREDGKTFYPA